MSRKNSNANAVRKVLRGLITELEDQIEEIRETAGFHALEALEAENQDARDCREKALKLSARASAFVEVIDKLKDRCPGCNCDGPRSWTVTAMTPASEM